MLYQTWARGPGHRFYPLNFAKPPQMQQELVEGYEAARGALVKEFGQEVVAVAPVGEAFAAMGFDPRLYGEDIYHAGPPGSLLAAMVLYRTLYGGRIADISARARQDASAAERWAGIDERFWNQLAAAADGLDIPRNSHPVTATAPADHRTQQ